MLDVSKYLKKMNIEIQSANEKEIVLIEDGVEKIINMKKLEQYLFICLTDFIKEAK